MLDSINFIIYLSGHSEDMCVCVCVCEINLANVILPLYLPPVFTYCLLGYGHIRVCVCVCV